MRVLLFARLRELAGWHERVVDAAEGATMLELWRELEGTVPALAGWRSSTRVARNGRIESTWTASLCEGDELALLPPGSGG